MVTIKMPNLGPLNRPLRAIRRHLPPPNFITLHYTYFISTCLLSALVFWGSSTPFRSVSFSNALFLAISAMTGAGLNTINLSSLNTFQQFILFLLLFVGSPIFVSAFVVHVRRKAFERKFVDFKKRRGRRGSLSRVRTWATNTMGRPSAETARDGDGTGSRSKDEEKLDNEREATTEGTLTRSSTPPERRGGPEMNSLTRHNTAEMSDDIRSHTNGEEKAVSPTRNPGITFRDDTRFKSSQPPDPHDVQPVRRHSSIFVMQGVGARSTASLQTSTSIDFRSFPTLNRVQQKSLAKGAETDISRYFETATGWVARNSQFHGLTESEREKLGGYEYRAISLLAWLVPVYIVAWQLLGCIGCGAWVALNRPGAALTNSQNPWWAGAFNAVSAFNNSGMSLVDANMIAFQRSYYMLLTMGLLILAGNTCYPLFLRLIVWCMYTLSTRLSQTQADSDSWSERAKTLRFLLDHPRRCYTTLFPSRHTWWLALVVFILNTVDWAAFEILNIGNSELDDGLQIRFRVIDGLFQAFAVRSGGFYVVPIPSLRISLQVLYVVMMYISVYPVVITMRNSNVYEERSLGIYAEDQEKEDEEQDQPKGRDAGVWLKRAKTIGGNIVSSGNASSESNVHFVSHQVRAQLAHDIWWIVLAIFLIMIIEGHNFHTKPVIFSVFNVIFETVSAYGCVGISVGVPYADYSFCGAWHTLSQLILCAVMLRGRHRGLPVAIDKAVLLPRESLGAAEEEDGRIRTARTLERGRPDFAIV